MTDKKTSAEKDSVAKDEDSYNSLGVKGGVGLNSLSKEKTGKGSSNSDNRSVIEGKVEKIKRNAELLEKLAELEHKQWQGWRIRLQAEFIDTGEIAPSRWALVEYKNLPEMVKEEDRVWARKVLFIVLDEIDKLITPLVNSSITGEKFLDELETFFQKLGDLYKETVVSLSKEME